MNPSFVFFGSSPFSKMVLEELVAAGFKAGLIIDDAKKLPAVESLKKQAWDVFVVASYGRIIPSEILAIPRLGSLNVHPSLLPKLRGPSPIQATILDAPDEESGVSIMVMDEQVDHGPIIAQKKLKKPSPWPPTYDVLEELLARAGGKLLAEILPEWCAKKIVATPQDDSAATFTTKITKEDGEIAFDPGQITSAGSGLIGDPWQNFKKIQAFSRWPKAHFFIERKTKTGIKTLRIAITAARFENGQLTIEHVIPEGKQEMNWRDFAKGYL
jgi:methionyl-tRNA formyltransferase